jgi:hypothetical protein
MGGVYNTADNSPKSVWEVDGNEEKLETLNHTGDVLGANTQTRFYTNADEAPMKPIQNNQFKGKVSQDSDSEDTDDEVQDGFNIQNQAFKGGRARQGKAIYRGGAGETSRLILSTEGKRPVGRPRKPKNPVGRPKGSKNKIKALPQTLDDIIALAPRQVSRQPTRPPSVIGDESETGSNFRAIFNEEDDVWDEDDDDDVDVNDSELSNSIYNYDPYKPSNDPDDDDSETDAVYPDYFTGYIDTQNYSPLAEAIIRASQQAVRCDVLFNSKVKSNLNLLPRIAVQGIISSITDIKELFNRLNQTLISKHLGNGDMLYLELNNRINKLQLDVLIAYRSYLPSNMTGGFRSIVPSLNNDPHSIAMLSVIRDRMWCPRKMPNL